MTIDPGVVVAVVAALSFIASMWVMVARFNTRMVRIEERLKNLKERLDKQWRFQINRAKSEAVKAGIATVNPHLRISPEAKKWMDELKLRLRDFYATMGRHLNEFELMEEIEAHYGQEIADNICIPHGLTQGECLLIAMEVAKEVAPTQ